MSRLDREDVFFIGCFSFIGLLTIASLGGIGWVVYTLVTVFKTWVENQ